jgi:hypothetical protein
VYRELLKGKFLGRQSVGELRMRWHRGSMVSGWEVDETGSASCPVHVYDTELSGFTFRISFIYRAYAYHLNQFVNIPGVMEYIIQVRYISDVAVIGYQSLS